MRRTSSFMIEWNQKPYVPAIRRHRTELDDAVVLQRLQRCHSQAEPRTHPRRTDPVVDDLEHESLVVALDGDGHVGGRGVLVGVAKRLEAHGLGKRLDAGWNLR